MNLFSNPGVTVSSLSCPDLSMVDEPLEDLGMVISVPMGFVCMFGAHTPFILLHPVSSRRARRMRDTQHQVAEPSRGFFLSTAL